MASRYYYGAVLAATIASAASVEDAAVEDLSFAAPEEINAVAVVQRDLGKAWGHGGWDGWSPSSSSSGSKKGGYSGKKGGYSSPSDSWDGPGWGGPWGKPPGWGGGWDGWSPSSSSSGSKKGGYSGKKGGYSSPSDSWDGPGWGGPWGKPPAWGGGWNWKPSSSSPSGSKKGGYSGKKGGYSGKKGSSPSSSSCDGPWCGGGWGGPWGHGGGWGGWKPSSSSPSGSKKGGYSGKKGGYSGKKGSSPSSSSCDGPWCGGGWGGPWGKPPGWGGGWGWKPSSSSSSGSKKGGYSGKKGSSPSSSTSCDGPWCGGGWGHPGPWSGPPGWGHDGWSSPSSPSGSKKGGYSGKKGGYSSPSSSEDHWSGDGWTGSEPDHWSGSKDDWSGSKPSGDDWSDGSGGDSWATGWKPDGWSSDGHYKADLGFIRSEIVRLIHESKRELIPDFIRLAFHSCVGPGGCDGCIDLDDVDNNGLEAAIEGIWPAVDKFDGMISRADIWVFAALVALDMSIVYDRPDGLRFPMRSIGRKNCMGADKKGNGGPGAKFPSSDFTSHQMLKWFEMEFDFDATETAVALGVHSISVATRENSGFGALDIDDADEEVGWVENGPAYVLDNRYYSSLLDRDWKQVLLKNGDLEGDIPNRYQWISFAGPKKELIFMTNSDVALARDLKGYMFTDQKGNEGAASCSFNEGGYKGNGPYDHDHRQLQRRRLQGYGGPPKACPKSDDFLEIIEDLKDDNHDFLKKLEKTMEKMFKKVHGDLYET